MLKLEQSTSSNRFCKRFDFVLWALLSLAPVLTWLVFLFNVRDASHILNFSEWITFYFVFGYSSNPIFIALSSLFGSSSGIFPFLYPSWLSFFTWFCTVEIVHLAVDTLLFIVRLAHKWIGGLIS